MGDTSQDVAKNFNSKEPEVREEDTILFSQNSSTLEEMKVNNSKDNMSFRSESSKEASQTG